MTTKVEKSIEVDAPVRAVYDQWTQFEEFPQFMGGVSQVQQLTDTRLHWVAEIAGVKREWDATILEQVPDQKIAWAATEGATNAGAVFFAPLGADRTMVRLELEYAPEGLVEKAGDLLGIVSRRAEADLEKFKAFMEARGAAGDGWRGEVPGATQVGTPGVEQAAQTRGDSGKAGLSGKVVAGAAAAVAVAAAATMKGGKQEESGELPPAPVLETQPVDVPPEPVVMDVEPVVLEAEPLPPVDPYVEQPLPGDTRSTQI